MLRLIAFCLGALAATIGAVAAVFHAPAHDFSSQGTKSAYLDALSADALTQLKLGVRHTFDIGLFGNSRSIMVGSQELDTPCSFFNYSIPGTTFRTSVALLEALAAQNRAPNLAVISLDNLEIQMMAIPNTYRPC
ncbi:hypothetical protein [Pseudorhodoplanes sp.]|uniref:hypothetical protein n=1 Tax=Pseudorhodoplanes sp. TaxID=1934341 RepID=UPI002CA08024|nr:hypothetical protein [Pseudorhodoplanes sp.]HWV55305.1 hypothetical protein [Pseudorhodoplanes sp.]